MQALKNYDILARLFVSLPATSLGDTLRNKKNRFISQKKLKKILNNWSNAVICLCCLSVVYFVKKNKILKKSSIFVASEF